MMSRHPIRLGRFGHQVIVIAHHRVGMHPPPRLLTNLPQRLQPQFAILLISINRLAVVPLRHHMIPRPSIFDPDLSSHPGPILSLTSSVNLFPRPPGRTPSTVTVVARRHWRLTTYTGR